MSALLRDVHRSGVRAVLQRTAKIKRHGKALFAAALAAIALTLPVAAQPARAPTRVIFDTDMWGDIDDVLALATLNTLQDRGEASLLAVTSSTDDPSTATFIDALDAFYGHGDIPVGLVRNGVTARQTFALFPFLGSDRGYTEALSRATRPDGSFVFPRAPMKGRSRPDAVALLRTTLAAQPDGSVVIIQVGFSTNLARLLASKGDAASPLDGMDLVRRKVRLLSVMAGAYADREGRPLQTGTPEFNLILDVPSARHLFDAWPTPIIASGFEIGASMRIDGAAVDRHYGYARHHPVAAAYHYVDGIYRTKQTPPGVLHNHATYDLTAVLYAIRPDDGYFHLSDPGQISVNPDGSSRFVARSGGTHRYLTMDDAQRPRALEAMTLLASEPPTARRRQKR
ncbi:MAG: Inosine/uridine-preferring nucleoside hydrolase [Sphingomonas bacterium]|nr:Inosine/uridine-preferring nucleoside hydrolase [Sphingomonas bacterium]